MKFGTKVWVTRGGVQRGNERKVRGKLVGAHWGMRFVKLEEDDKHDTVGWSRKGQVGTWSKSMVTERVE